MLQDKKSRYTIAKQHKGSGSDLCYTRIMMPTALRSFPMGILVGYLGKSMFPEETCTWLLPIVLPCQQWILTFLEGGGRVEVGSA